MIPFSKFAPDIDPTTPGVITSATNLIPTLRGYAGGPSGVDVGMDALAAAALTAAICTKLDGTNRLFVGTAAALYEKSGTAWTDVTRATAYNATTEYPWRFAQFGNTSLAVNKGDVLQSISSGTDFADVSGAPKAAVMTVVSGFVMLGNTNDGVNNDLDRWWCSAYQDETDWVTSVTTQCASGRLVDTPGAITAMKALGYEAVAYKEKSMYLGRYAGPPSVWDWSLIPGEIGCSSQESIADLGSEHVFIGFEDFYRFNGSAPVPIGSGIREWFFSDLDPSYRFRIRHTIDRVNSIVYWFYPRKGNSGSLNGCIAYNWKSDKWGVAHREVEASVEFISGGYTWNTIPISTWDDWPAVSYDSPYWTAAARYPAYIGTDHTIYSMTGASSSASLTTGDYGTDDAFTLLSRVTLRYLNKPTTATCTNYYQNEHGDAWTEDATTTESSGRFDFMRSAPWHRVKFDFTGDFEVSGASASTQPDGVY